MSDIEKLKKKAQSRGIGPDGKGGGYERHVIFCTGNDCASRSENEKSYKHLRKGIKMLEKETGQRIYCTETDCLDLCKGGPLAVVYPEGTWYHDLKPVEEFIITQNPLPARSEE
jgi:(2Fe-2S) ferredoxin